MQNNFVVRKIAEYRDCPVLVMQVGEIFIYMTMLHRKFYAGHIITPVPFFQKILLRSYTKKQLLDITNVMLTMAQATIDTVLNTT